MSAKTPKTKLCAGMHGCRRRRPLERFRMLSHGYRAAYCDDCERAWDRLRWHRRKHLVRPDSAIR